MVCVCVCVRETGELLREVIYLREVVTAATEVEDIVHDSRAEPTALDGEGGHGRPLILVWVVALRKT